DGAASFGPGEPTPLDVIMDRSKAGSNAFAVAGFRSASGAAILAADPHLGLPQPNIWATVAYRSPDSAALGFTIPGLPFVLVGRNEDIAWGVTNMQAAASVLYDVSDDDTRVEPRKERIGTRFWFDKTVEIENHPLGPVVTDALLFRGLPGPSALKWTGHEVSDEATAFLKLSQAEGWSDFTEAFSTFAAGGQNFIYADRSGRIGQILATRFVEAAGNAAWTVPADPDDPRFAWDDGLVGAELPTAIDPEEGYLVSANNTPVKIDPPVVPQGNADDRVLRMQDVLSRTEDATWEDLAELQLDVFSQASLDCAAALLPLAPEGELRSTIAGWDGNYDRESTGPVAYQRVMTELLPIAYRDRYSASLIGTLRGASYSHRWVREDIESGRITGEMVERAFESASKGYRPDRTWGDLHRTTLAHPIGQVPIIGSAYRFGDFASSGTLTTVYKSANGL
ncbi:MAG: penicillin acylase family protein, partial [Planctomycetota bacterium]